MESPRIMVVDPADNVATAVRTVDAGETVGIETGEQTTTVEVTDDIPFGHKIALEEIDEDGTVVKYGSSIGYASEPIATGEWVHVHNVESNYGRGDEAAADGGSE